MAKISKPKQLTQLDAFGTATAVGDAVFYAKSYGGTLGKGKVVRCTPSGFSIEYKPDCVVNRPSDKVVRDPSSGTPTQDTGRPEVSLLTRALEFYVQSSRDANKRGTYSRWDPSTAKHVADEGFTAREALRQYEQR